MLPYLQDEQIIVTMPGNFASLCFNRILNENNINKKIHLVESVSLPYACRVERPGNVHILDIKNNLSLSMLGENQNQNMISHLKEILPCCIEIQKNIFSAGFNCLNGIMHPATVLLNTGWTETTKGDFYFYKDGVSESVGKLLDKLDCERRKVAEKYGFSTVPFVDMLEQFYGNKYPDIGTFARNSKIHNKLKASPSSLNNRYVSEDVPYILVPWYNLAKLANCEVPAMETIISLASILSEHDYLKEGRNLASMGLQDLSKEEVTNLIQ